MSVKFEFKLPQDLIDRLTEIDRVLSDKDFRSLMQNIGDNLKDSAQERISNTKLSPKGRPWEDLDIKTERARARKGRIPDDILQSTGALKASIQTQIRSDFEIAIGSDLSYSKVHQEGYKPKNIPARPYLGVSSLDERDILREVDKFLARLVK